MKPIALANFFFPGIAAGLAIWLAAEHQALLKRTAEHQMLERQLHQMDDLVTRNEQLSNLLAEASAPEPLPRDQFMELLRLRGQVGALSRQQTDLDKVRDENHQAHAVLDGYLNTLTNPVATADYWPRGSWTNSGYASPEAALQTVFWAGYNGDVTNFLSSSTDEARKEFEDKYKGQSNGEASARLMDDTYNLSSVRILSRQVQDDNTVLLTLELEEQNNSQTGTMVMKNIDGQWKLAGPQLSPAEILK